MTTLFVRMRRRLKKEIKRFFLVSRGEVGKGHEITELLEQLARFTDKNRGMIPEVIKIPIRAEAEFAWCGGQYHKGCVYGIPDDEGSGFVFDPITGQDGRWGQFSDRAFKWTGGCVFEDKLYCFPRAENDLLVYDLIRKKTDIIKLGSDYKKEHHYGGVMIDGIIYQPPRDTDHILSIDVIHKDVKKIYLAPPWLKLRLRYCGSVVHPNGLIYFLPEQGNKVICFDPKTRGFIFIGHELDCMCFDGQVAQDGAIYAFSAYSKGILRVDVKTGQAEMLHTEISPGSYGTKIGPNGKLYSIPGDGDIFWEYDPVTDELREIERIASDEYAKCAGGAIDKKGNIYCIPTHGKALYMIAFANDRNVPEDLYDRVWKDCY